MLYNADIIIIFLFIYYLDNLSIYLNRMRFNNTNINHNTRWFFIHFFINLFITIATFNDLRYCLNNIESCSYSEISNNSMLSVKSAIIAHLYHCVFFFKKLNHHDWTHHILMVGVTGPLAVYYPTKQTSCALWFMTGLPGMLDYGLLWLVKMKYIHKKREKLAYKHINTWIRSPGCMLTLFLGLPKLLNPSNNNELTVAIINSILAYWNGQYYMMLTCESYGKSKALNNLKPLSY